jgi:hypothetical protein
MDENGVALRHPVIPADAGIQNAGLLDPGFRRGDEPKARASRIF